MTTPSNDSKPRQFLHLLPIGLDAASHPALLLFGQAPKETALRAVERSVVVHGEDGIVALANER